MTENKMNMPTNATNPNSTTPDITEAECHENLWKLMRLGSTIDYDQVINDPDLIEQYVEQITSMLYDGRATGRSFEELFPQMWLNSYRETDESYHEPRQRALPGLWPSEQAPHNWQMFDFYPRKSKEGYLPLPTFSAAAQVFFVRNQLLPLAMGTLRGGTCVTTSPEWPPTAVRRSGTAPRTSASRRASRFWTVSSPATT